MSSLGFTGTRNTKGREYELNNYLESADMLMYLRKFDTYVTGACVGWDAMIGRFLRLKFPPPIAEHIVIVPADQSRVERWWEEFDPGTVHVIQMAEGSDYRDRNTEIIRRSDQMFYVADYPEDHGKSKRSGTWMTVRLARNAGIEPAGIILNKEKTT